MQPKEKFLKILEEKLKQYPEFIRNQLREEIIEEFGNCN
jgi:hypothetical protein